ncbi:MAG: hypothetical protein LBF63_04220 [Treponema sp.]|nr:hypothetical protein [Treponema sp.]
MGRRLKLYLAVLVPHRDSRKVLRERSAELFRAGFWGAWSFPQVSPLALLRSPLTAAELGELARNLRALSLAGGRDGTLHPGVEAILPLAGLPEGAALYGPQLDLQPRPEDFAGAGDKLKELYPAPLVACAVLGPEDPREIPAGRRTGVYDFRAAAVANLSYRPIAAGGYSYAWRIGELHWLPRPRDRRQGGPESR